MKTINIEYKSRLFGGFEFRREKKEKIMDKIVVLIISALLLLTGSVGAMDDWKEGKEAIHVGGRVLCQDCTEGWKQWIDGAKPLQGCKVSVTCLDDRSRVMYYGSDLTDEAGDFDMIIINKHINGKAVNAENCFLRLVSSPDPVCNVATDFAGGKTGVKLHRPTVVYRDIIKYVLGPFYYTTPMCDEPDATSNGDDGSSDEEAKDSNYY